MLSVICTEYIFLTMFNCSPRKSPRLVILFSSVSFLNGIIDRVIKWPVCWFFFSNTDGDIWQSNIKHGVYIFVFLSHVKVLHGTRGFLFVLCLYPVIFITSVSLDGMCQECLLSMQLEKYGTRKIIIKKVGSCGPHVYFSWFIFS